MGKLLNALKGLYDSPKVRIAFIALVGAVVEHLTGALGALLGS